jgi:hypothetical protein
VSEGKGAATGLDTLDSLSIDVLTDDVSDNNVSKTLFAVSESSNVVRHEHSAADPSTHQHFTRDGFTSISFMSDQPFAVHKPPGFSQCAVARRGIQRQRHSLDRRDGREVHIPPGRHAITLDECPWIAPKKTDWC